MIEIEFSVKTLQHDINLFKLSTAERGCFSISLFEYDYHRALFSFYRWGNGDWNLKLLFMDIR